MRKASKIHVLIDSPSGVIFEGDVKGLSLKNELGPFDVIQQHTNFISAISNEIILLNFDNSKKTFPIDKGILKINKLGVQIFLGIEPISENIENSSSSTPSK